VTRDEGNAADGRFPTASMGVLKSCSWSSDKAHRLLPGRM
jgi:hypothetical protein